MTNISRLSIRINESEMPEYMIVAKNVADMLAREAGHLPRDIPASQVADEIRKFRPALTHTKEGPFR